MELCSNVNDFSVIAQEFAPTGRCHCQAEDDGCPFCNPLLIPAWKKSCQIEEQLMDYGYEGT